MVSVDGGRKQKDPVLYPPQRNWLNMSQHCGRWESPAAPWIPYCPILWNATVSWRHCQGDGYQESWLKQGACRMWGSSPHSELRASPYSKRTECPFLSEQLGCYTCHLQSSSKLWNAHRSSGLTISGTPGMCRSQSSKTQVSLGGFFLHWDFFIMRTPRCSWFWEVFCPHTK